jgi:GNAT superfamily N-acetyltransferase
MKIEIRDAIREDSPIILDFIKGIATYEKLLNEVEANVSDIEKSIFDQKDAYVVLAFDQETPIGFALYFYNYSTFKGRKGLYLEDLFVRETYRSQGVGNQLFEFLRKKAKKENCGRMEWVCLDWNQNAIDFYTKKGAKPMQDWTIFRLDETKL